MEVIHRGIMFSAYYGPLKFLRLSSIPSEFSKFRTTWKCSQYAVKYYKLTAKLDQGVLGDHEVSGAASVADTTEKELYDIEKEKSDTKQKTPRKHRRKCDRVDECGTQSETDAESKMYIYRSDPCFRSIVRRPLLF